MNWNRNYIIAGYKRLYRTIKHSKEIPKKYKEEILNTLVKNDDIVTVFLGDGEKVKNLLSTSIFYRAYEIYTASILAIIYENKTLINLLLRSQIENKMITNYLLKNPNEIKKAFNDENLLRKAKKFEKDSLRNEIWVDLSKKVHPLPDAFKLYFDGIYFFDFKDGKPTFIPSYRLVLLHEKINKENKETIIQLIIHLFEDILSDLFKLNSLPVEDKISDFSRLWRNYQI